MDLRVSCLHLISTTTVAYWQPTCPNPSACGLCQGFRGYRVHLVRPPPRPAFLRDFRWIAPRPALLSSPPTVLRQPRVGATSLTFRLVPRLPPASALPTVTTRLTESAAVTRVIPKKRPIVEGLPTLPPKAALGYLIHSLLQWDPPSEDQPPTDQWVDQVVAATLNLPAELLADTAFDLDLEHIIEIDRKAPIDPVPLDRHPRDPFLSASPRSTHLSEWTVAL